MEFSGENFNEIKKQIKETEAEIDNLTESLKDMHDEKNRICSKYETEKAEYEDLRSKYSYMSTYGLYFLIVTAVVFVFVAYRVFQNSLDDFFMFPATALLVAGIVGRIVGTKKFNSMTPVMKEKEAAFNVTKKEYDEFMSNYNGTEEKLEEQQLKWELVENDMIEARKEAWIKEQSKLKANA